MKNDFLLKVNKFIQLHIDDEHFKSEALSQKMQISRSQLFRKIKAYTGFSTALYIRHIRLQESATLLVASNFSIKVVAYAVGFRDIAYFSRCFRNTFKCSPSQYRLNAISSTNTVLDHSLN